MGQEGIVRLFLETGQFSVDLADKAGRTPLSWAAEIGREAVVRLLLGTGQVDVNSADTAGRTPLSWAARMGRKAVTQIILEMREINPVKSADTDDHRPVP